MIQLRKLPKLATNIAAAALTIASISAYAAPHTISDSNFSMLDNTGALVGGATDVFGTFEDTLICSAENCTDIGMTLASNEPFFGVAWTAHDVRVFGPGTYTFDTDCTSADIAAGITNCGDGPYLNLTVGQNQLGAHMLFDWGASSDIDVAVLWDFNSAFGSPIYNTTDPAHTPTKVWNVVSRDGDSNSIRGIAMVDGPFVAFEANFSLDMAPPLPNPNSPPVANDDNRSALIGVPSVINVVANDFDVEDGWAPPVPPAALSNLPVTSDLGYNLTDNGNGTITYEHTGAAAEQDSFQYTLLDSNGLPSDSPATVTLFVGTANNEPVAADPGGVNTDEDASLDIPVSTVASDADVGDTITFHVFDAQTAQGGTVDAPNNTTLTYNPPADYFGPDSFNYQVTDGVDDSNLASLAIAVNAVNDPLVCTDVTLNADTNSTLDIDVTNELLSTCTDTENDPISLDSTSQPTVPGSMLTFDGSNTLTYTPATDFEGTDTFTYTATDGTDFDTRTVEVNVGLVLSNFTMLDSTGASIGGTNDVVFNWDGMENTAETDLNFNAEIFSQSSWNFNGFPWTAHNVRVFGEGSYSFDTDCTVAEIEATGCPAGAGTNLSMTVGPGQLGAHMLFDWNVTENIDVVLVWDRDQAWDQLGATDPKNKLWLGPAGTAPDPSTDWELVSRDVDSDGINGARMVDGPFVGFSANFNIGPKTAGESLPVYTGTAMDTKLGSGLFASPMNPWVLIAVFTSLFGARRFRKNLY